jgi:hypothetical protein
MVNPGSPGTTLMACLHKGQLSSLDKRVYELIQNSSSSSKFRFQKNVSSKFIYMGVVYDGGQDLRVLPLALPTGAVDKITKFRFLFSTLTYPSTQLKL